MHDQTDIQATQHIIDLFESSKSQSEEALESLPGIYVVITRDGSILKGNRALAKLLNVSHERLLGRNLSELFSASSWSRFSAQMGQLDASSESAEFQLDLGDGGAFGISSYWWYASRLQTKRSDLPSIIAILGRDVTDLKQATEKGARMQLELQTAKMVQDTLFPEPHSKIGTSEIAGFYESATECGGDWWFYCPVKDKLFLWIGDVTGHGVPAALLTSVFRSVVSTIEDQEFTPSEALSIMNRAVIATAHSQRAATFVVVSVDLKTGQCSYASAGHEPPLLIPVSSDATEPKVAVLMSPAILPLGSQAGIKYVEREFTMNPGDRLFMYTDGIYDICDPGGNLWGRKAARRCLAAKAGEFRDAKGLVNAFATAMSAYRRDSALLDDVTFFVFKR